MFYSPAAKRIGILGSITKRPCEEERTTLDQGAEAVRLLAQVGRQRASRVEPGSLSEPIIPTNGPFSGRPLLVPLIGGFHGNGMKIQLGATGMISLMPAKKD
jgi:hypothetical protein